MQIEGDTGIVWVDDNIAVGIFKQWQPRYASLNIPTFPVDENKKPRNRGYLRTGLRGSRKLAGKFSDANTLGYAAGDRTGIVLVDIDDQNYGVERVEEEFGRAPIVIRTPSGGHYLPYRHRGERRRIRPYPEKPIDIIGGGYVVAPPSRVAKGEYEIIRGSLDDLKNLPPLGKFLDGIRWSRMGEGDGRQFH
jgi:hypothetical protein